MTSAVLLVTESIDVASKTATVFEFIDHKVVHATGADEAGKELANGKFLVALLLIESESSQTDAIELINKQSPSLPIYLLRTGEDADKTAIGVGDQQTANIVLVHLPDRTRQRTAFINLDRHLGI